MDDELGTVLRQLARTCVAALTYFELAVDVDIVVRLALDKSSAFTQDGSCDTTTVCEYAIRCIHDSFRALISDVTHVHLDLVLVVDKSRSLTLLADGEIARCRLAVLAHLNNY
jgi:hypothetical protein